MSKKILIIGKNSNIAKKFIKKISKSSLLAPDKKNWNMLDSDFKKSQIKEIINSDKILLLQSTISSKDFLKRHHQDIVDQFTINFLSVVKICEIALNNNKNVRIIILGSESGVKGSFDIIYGLMKSAIHKYVEERRIKFPKQQLVCVAPSTIIDANMTLNRKDKHNVKSSILKNPKKRGLKSSEIANLLYDIFYKHTDYISNTVIRVDGGKFARM
jgi:hypothetical protein